MKNYRNNIDKKKNLLNYSECIKLLNQKQMNNIGKGGQGDVFKAVSDKCGSIVLKYFRSDANETVKNKYDLINKLKQEYNIMTGLKILIDYRYCPNYIEIIDLIPNKRFIVMEYADENCKVLFEDSSIESKIIYSFFCQVLIGLLCFVKLNNMIHNDFKLDNILYKRIDKRVVFKYNINGEDFYVPSYGYLFMIADFGMCLNTEYYKMTEQIDINRLINSIDIILVKKLLADKKNNNPALYTDKFKEIIKNKNIELSLINFENMLEVFKNELKIPLLNDEELEKYGINSEIIRIKKILSEETELLNIIKKIILNDNGDKKYEQEYIETFSFNF